MTEASGPLSAGGESDPYVLVARLDGDAEIVATCRAIVAAGAAAVPALVGYLAGTATARPQARVAAVECLGEIGGERAVAALLAVVEGERPVSPDPVVALADEIVRDTAARELARFADLRVIPVLLRALAEQHLIGAGESLAGLGEPAAIPHLIACLEDGDKRERARLALRQFGRRAVTKLALAVITPHVVAGSEARGSVLRRVGAAQLLRELHAPAAVAALRDGLADRERDVSVAAALALVAVAPAETHAGPLLAGLDDADVAVLRECTAALAALGALASDAVRAAALGEVIILPSGERHCLSPAGRRRAIALLRRGDPAQFIDAGTALLRDDDAAVRHAAVEELTRCDHSGRFAHLARAARDRDVRTRTLARAALRERPSRWPLWLNRNVLGMTVAGGLSAAAYELGSALLPTFLTALGPSVAVLGAVEACAGATGGVARLAAGRGGARLRRRRTVVAGGHILAGTAQSLFAVAGGWPLVLVGRVLGRLGDGARGPLRDALLLSSVDPAERRKAVGLHRAAAGLGTVIGPLLGAALIGRMGVPVRELLPFRIAFAAALIPGLAAVAAFALLVREQPDARRPAITAGRWIESLPPSFKRVLLGAFVFGLADFAPTLLVLRAAELLLPAVGATPATQAAAGLYAIRNFFRAGITPVAGALRGRKGRTLLPMTYVLAALTFVGFMRAAPTPAFLCLLFGCVGIVAAGAAVLERKVAADLLSPEHHAAGYAALGAAGSLGGALSSLVVGLLWAHVSVGMALGYAATLALAAAAIVARAR